MSRPELPRVLTVEELAAELRISRGAAYEAVRSGQIPSIKIGRTLRVPRRALVDLLGEDDLVMEARRLDGP